MFLFERNRVVQFVLILTAAAVCTTALADQKKGKDNKPQEKRDGQRIENQKEDVQKVQKQLQDDLRDLAAAEKLQAQAVAKLKAAAANEKAERDRVAAAQERAVGIDAALEQQTAARKVYDDAAAPVLVKLKASPAYQAAKAKANTATETLKSLKSQPNLSELDRQRQQTAASDALALSQLEQETLSNEPGLKPLKDKLEQAQERVADLRAKIKSAVERDSAVVSAHGAVEGAKGPAELAETKVAQLRQKVAAARARLAKESADVQKAKLADKANDKKNDNKKGKKK